MSYNFPLLIYTPQWILLFVEIGINLLSSVQPNDFKQRLISGEVKLLTSLPGIGPKTAKRIIIELKDKFITTDKNDMPIENNQEGNSDA